MIIPTHKLVLMLCLYLYHPDYKESEWVIKFNSLSMESGQPGPYSPYKLWLQEELHNTSVENHVA